MSLSPKALTLRWLEEVVVGLNLCPFAKRELSSDRIRMVVADAHDKEAGAEAWLQVLAAECQILDNDEAVGTTLLLFTKSLASFEEYLDFVALAEALMQSLDYEGTYQLASFHPDYCFEGSASDDAANYTNRSPYPMLHLLREDEVSQAVASHPAPESIPERNQRVCRELGVARLAALMQK